ncbi:MAG: alpha-amylase family glycosyl hydrolase [Treponema sp.]|nr:alpha-amylase family glycosyl hydrolase [Treponema sp.]
MAGNTGTDLRNLVIYSVYVRNHSEEGTFKGLERDLGRIKELGTDIIWLLPIHPIGKKNRKGTLGSPYANEDYRTVNPEYGSYEDFVSLVNEIHKRGMKCIIDVVYNHTSPDSWLVKNHPEWFFRKPDGSFGNRTGAWLDVIDLDYNQAALWDYLIETLKYWAKLVDGFRCDVASLIPLDFWKRAREEVSLINPNCLWLAESVHPSFIFYNRSLGFPCLSDSEVFSAFDITYDYDIYDWYTGYLEGKNSLAEYADRINNQEMVYPANYVKLRCLENHDQRRIKFYVPDEKALFNWTAFLYFQKGTAMIYAGQETQNDHHPSLFENDKVNWNTGCDISKYMAALYKIKKDSVFADSQYSVKAFSSDIIAAVHKTQKRMMIGVFSLKGSTSVVSIEQVKEGKFINLIDGASFRIEEHKLSCRGEPVIFEAPLDR